MVYIDNGSTIEHYNWNIDPSKKTKISSDIISTLTKFDCHQHANATHGSDQDIRIDMDNFNKNISHIIQSIHARPHAPSEYTLRCKHDDMT